MSPREKARRGALPRIRQFADREGLEAPKELPMPDLVFLSDSQFQALLSESERAEALVPGPGITFYPYGHGWLGIPMCSTNDPEEVCLPVPLGGEHGGWGCKCHYMGTADRPGDARVQGAACDLSFTSRGLPICSRKNCPGECILRFVGSVYPLTYQCVCLG